MSGYRSAVNTGYARSLAETDERVRPADNGRQYNAHADPALNHNGHAPKGERPIPEARPDWNAAFFASLCEYSPKYLGLPSDAKRFDPAWGEPYSAFVLKAAEMVSEDYFAIEETWVHYPENTVHIEGVSPHFCLMRTEGWRNSLRLAFPFRAKPVERSAKAVTAQVARQMSAPKRRWPDDDDADLAGYDFGPQKMRVLETATMLTQAIRAAQAEPSNADAQMLPAPFFLSGSGLAQFLRCQGSPARCDITLGVQRRAVVKFLWEIEHTPREVKHAALASCNVATQYAIAQCVALVHEMEGWPSLREIETGRA